MPLRVMVAVLTALLLSPLAAVAQSASVDQDTQLRIEAKRKRLLVRPEAPVAAAVRDAERAGQETAAAEIARRENDPVRRRPQLDYDVTSALTARNAQRARR